jgi:hypothetical protein
MAKKPNLKAQNDGFVTVHTVRIPLWPYLVPVLFCLVALPTTWGAHHAYGRDASRAGWAGVALALFGVGMIMFTFAASRPRGGLMCAMATFNAGLSMVWITPAVLNGPFTAGMIGVWLIGSLWVCTTNALYRIMRQARGDDAGNPSVINGAFGELGDAVKQLKDVRFGRPAIEGARVSAAVEMPPGRTFDEVSGARGGVASLLDVKATAVRTIPDADSERRGVVTVVPVDQLREPIPDPGLEPGLSIADPIVLGVAEDGSPAQIILPGDPRIHRNAVGVMGVLGMSGSGKTELLLRLAKCVATRHDNELNIIDCRKAGQLPGWLKRAAVRVVDGKDAALDWMEDLEQRIAERAQWLGSRGFKQWVRGCGVPFETYVIFEAASIVKESNIVDLSEAVRSVGMCIVLELQRATWDRLPTSARSNMTTWVILGVQGEGDAEGALSDDMGAAGAAPWKWKNGKPGYFYLQWAGRDEDLWSAPCRSFIQDDADREQEVAEALGWNSTGHETPAVEPYTPPRGGQAPDDDEGEEPAEDYGTGADPDDPPDDADPAEPIVVPPGMPRIPFGDARPKMPPGEALGLLRSHVFTLQQAGVPYVQSVDLSDVLAQTGLSSTWMRNSLKTLCGEGVLREPRPGERGVYRVVQRERAGVGAAQ